MSGYAVRNDGQGFRSVDDKASCEPNETFLDFADGPPPPPVAPPPDAGAVDAERDRRIDADLEFREVKYQSRAADRENIAGAAQLGFVALAGGAQAGDLRWSSPDEDFVWISSDNNPVPMDAPTVVEFGKVSVQRKQALIMAGRRLKDMTVIPADYTNDKWWP